MNRVIFRTLTVIKNSYGFRQIVSTKFDIKVPVKDSDRPLADIFLHEHLENDVFRTARPELVRIIFTAFRRCVTIEECRNISAPITRESNKKQMLIVENMCRVDCPFGQEIGIF